MSQSLEYQIYYDSSRTPAPAVPGVEPRDVAGDQNAVAALSRLGIRVAEDLPAALLSEPGGKLRLIGLRLSAEEFDKLSREEGFEQRHLRVLGTGWCPDCSRAKRVIAEAGVAFDEVDIDHDAKCADELVKRSGGRRVVPTLVFGDRLWAFNPAPPLLRRLLAGATS